MTQQPDPRVHLADRLRSLVYRLYIEASAADASAWHTTPGWAEANDFSRQVFVQAVASMGTPLAQKLGDAIDRLLAEVASLRVSNDTLKAQAQALEDLASAACSLAIRAKGKKPTFAQSQDLIDAAIRFGLGTPKEK